MSKKPVISKEAQVLLKLLRIALGTEEASPKSSPEGKDLLSGLSIGQWKEVVRLSYEHKVSALAVDGLEASKYDPYQGLDEKEAEELKAVLVPWIKDVENTEWSYCYYVEVLKTLCQILRDNGLTPIILKGYGLSLNYPRPSHRGAGDIDVFLVDREGRPAAEEGDRIAREVLQLEVTRHGNEHHSSFTFKGILVENHYELKGKIFNTAVEDKFLEQLKELVSQDIVPILNINNSYFPSATFNAIFLMRHMIGDIHHRLFNLRQIVDWVSFLKNNDTDVDWKKVEKIQSDGGLTRFAYDFNVVALKLLRYKTHLTSPFVCSPDVDQIIRVIFNPIQPGESKIQRITYYYRNRWATRYYFNQSWLRLFFQVVYIHLPFVRK